jgi:hypothetical protein
MLRAFFFAVGVFTTFLGVECLLVDRAVLNIDRSISQQQRVFPMVRSSVGPKREVNPPEWLGWSLISAGAVTSLYSVALPKKKD